MDEHVPLIINNYVLSIVLFLPYCKFATLSKHTKIANVSFNTQYYIFMINEELDFSQKYTIYKIFYIKRIVHPHSCELEWAYNLQYTNFSINEEAFYCFNSECGDIVLNVSKTKIECIYCSTLCKLFSILCFDRFVLISFLFNLLFWKKEDPKHRIITTQLFMRFHAKQHIKLVFRIH